MEECDQSNLNVSDKLGMFISLSATFVLQMIAQVSLKVATKGSLRGKTTWKIFIFEAIFLK